ncbi:MAG: hypothetical protein GY936_05970 [Ignavibacteriae bacterium]|nr:hypothetical protein [Ignavibacteriota bacterium]
MTILFIVSLMSCSSEKVNYEEKVQHKTSVKKSFIIGQIAVVGNEPFTELGLIVNDTTVYTLDCNKELKETLLKNQGQNYKIFIKDGIKYETKNKLSVIAAEKI